MKFYCLLSGCFGLICLQTAVAMAQPVSPPPNRVVTPAQQTSPLETVEPVMPVAPVPSPNLNNSPRPLPRQRPVVVIDPGHGGLDPGAMGIGGIYEREPI